ncbi:MAG: ABC transporter ATP-binding protein [Planctomycetes bacterium]|nr:ABC transporter ATP-binding protein [Planctomycetota bacterium]
MMLALHGEVARGAQRLWFDLDVAPGETVALVGPNGAGKSSCVEAIAGLLRLQRGELRLGEVVLDSPAAGSYVPPEARGIGWLPQDGLLFPHLSARDNVAYGRRTRSEPARAARARADAALARVGLAGFGDRRPRQLSGGEAQRVALARALAAEPRALLLDEPLSAVDASARVALRQELQRALVDFPGPRLLVTHDAVDAFALADRIAVVEQGRVVQVGTAAVIGGSPRTRYVADLVGLNFLRGHAHDGVFIASSGGRLVVASPIEGPALATVHPRALALFTSKPTGSPRNVWQANVAAIEALPSGRRVRFDGEMPLVAEVTAAAVAELGIAVGRPLWLALKATEVRVAEA